MSNKRKRTQQRRAAAAKAAPARNIAAKGPEAQAPVAKAPPARRSPADLAAVVPKASREAKPKQKPAPRSPRAATRPRDGGTPAAGRIDPFAIFGAAAVGFLAFVLYALTVQPSAPTGDSAELIAASYVLGVAHPPGYPLYMLLGHVAMWFPGGSPAERMNLLSGLLDAAAVGVVFLVIYRLITQSRDGATAVARRWPPLVAAAVGSLLLAFSTLFWAYSVVAEVFALNNLFAALLLLIGLEWARRPERIRLLWLWMFVFGLALCNQQTIILLVPAFVVLLALGWWLLPADLRPRQNTLAGKLQLRFRGRDLGFAVGALAAGLLPLIYLPISASQDPTMNWGDPDNLTRFQQVIERQNYGSLSLTVGGKPGTISQNLDLFFGGLMHGFVYAGLALALLGLWWGWRSGRRTEVGALLTAFLVAGPVFLAYTHTGFPDQLTRGIIARFYILPSVPLAIAAGAGAWWLLREASTLRVAVPPKIAMAVVAVALLVAPAAAAVDHYSANDQSDNYVLQNYGHDLLSPLKKNALLLMRSDQNYDSVAYTQNVEHFRTDVVALDVELLKIPSYVAQARREHPDVVIPFPEYDDGAKYSLNTMIQANLPDRPVYYIGVMKEKKFGKPFNLLFDGLARELVPKGASPDSYALLAADPQQFAKMHYPPKTYPKDTWEGSALATNYAFVAFYLGYALQVDAPGKNVALAEQMYRTALRLRPSFPQAYKDLGLILHDNNGDPNEIIALWTKYLKLAPHDSQAPAIRQVLAGLEAKKK
ncbi:MAG TPA: DUF2723 domain-containing protein [Gaiellaceae bacterium]|jgi:tetratricopeptide (TPR) repeat protein